MLLIRTNVVTGWLILIGHDFSKRSLPNKIDPLTCLSYFSSVDLQPADIGWPTENGKKLSNSQACCLAQLCLAPASFLSISCGSSFVRGYKPMFHQFRSVGKVFSLSRVRHETSHFPYSLRRGVKVGRLYVGGARGAKVKKWEKEGGGFHKATLPETVSASGVRRVYSAIRIQCIPVIVPSDIVPILNPHFWSHLLIC